ncbi:MAG: S-adenosyl-l-methionine hydroxide adenosyltransferase family protein [Acidimicrobiales bacterium]
MTPTAAGPPGAGADTVFFLSDYGRSDEFVGVVHAVLRRLAPGAAVIDLCHDVPPFSVAAGAGVLARALPHLGPGVVLAVVDPGVGGPRRSVVVEVGAGPGPRWFVGPDNGLVWPAVQAAGGAVSVTEVAAPSAGAAATFDGRDVLAPAVAALCAGEPPGAFGRAADPETLVHLEEPAPELVEETGGLRRLRSVVTWVDRFGNAQLSAGGDLLPPTVGEVTLHLAGLPPRRLPRVRAFADLGAGEAGVLVDANGRLALVVREGSASAGLGLSAGMPVEAVW